MRWVSLCPSLTELVFQLGAGEHLVGVTKFCVEPADGVSELPEVGGTKNPRIDRILDLAPELVVMNEEENRAEDAAALTAAGIQVWSSLPRTLDDGVELPVELGRAIGREAAGQALRDRLHAAVEAARARSERLAPVRYACLIWRRPWMAIGGGTYAESLLGAVGGRNVFGDRTGYPEFDLEALAKLRPDRVLLPDEPFPFAPEHVEELARGAGMDPACFRTCSGRPLFWHGSQTLEGLELAERCLRR